MWAAWIHGTYGGHLSPPSCVRSRRMGLAMVHWHKVVQTKHPLYGITAERVKRSARALHSGGASGLYNVQEAVRYSFYLKRLLSIRAPGTPHAGAR